MVDAGIRRTPRRREKPGLRRPWCCSFGLVPGSPEIGGASAARCTHHRHPRVKPSKPAYAASFQSSPSPSSKMGLGLIGPRRMLSPGRVSPIDSDAPLPPLPASADAASVATTTVESETECVDAPPKEETPLPTQLSTSSSDEVGGVSSETRAKGRSMDLRLSLKGKDGRCLVLDLDSGVLCRDSKLFAAMVTDAHRKASDASAECRKIEVAEIEELSVFKDTIELMHEKDLTKRLMKAGVHRCIEILEIFQEFGRVNEDD